MKKSILLAVLGLTTGGVSSFSQGYVIFSSYLANNGAGATTTINGSSLVGAGWTAGLYYFIGTISDPVNNNNAASSSSLPTGLINSGVTANYLSGYNGQGYFDGSSVLIPGYSSGPITFEVVAYYGGSSYATASLRARSGSFTMNSIAVGPTPAPSLGDNGQPMPNIIILAPEPTTLTLAGWVAWSHSWPSTESSLNCNFIPTYSEQ